MTIEQQAILPNFPTREAIERAGAIDWAPKPRRDPSVDIHAVIDGFPMTITTTLKEVRSTLRTLRELGAQGIIAPPTRKQAL